MDRETKCCGARTRLQVSLFLILATAPRATGLHATLVREDAKSVAKWWLPHPLITDSAPALNAPPQTTVDPHVIQAYGRARILLEDPEAFAVLAMAPGPSLFVCLPRGGSHSVEACLWAQHVERTVAMRALLAWHRATFAEDLILGDVAPADRDAWDAL